MRSKRYWAHLIIVKNYHVYVSRTGKVPNIYDVISYIMTSSPWRSLFAWRVTNHLLTRMDPDGHSTVYTLVDKNEQFKT